MITYLNIIEGPQKGFRFKARTGITIGGAESHIDLKDVTVTGIHARILIDDDQQLYIHAENEQKGTYFNSKRIKKRRLEQGSKIRIGKTTLYITMKPATAVKVENKSTDQWLDIIRKKYQEFSALPKERPINLVIMNPVINLHFVKGLQMKTDWTLGYGPRIIGSDSYDLKIYEPNAPDICFELIPSDKGIIYQTDYANVVRINGKKSKNKILENDDRISILETEIVVSVLK